MLGAATPIEIAVTHDDDAGQPSRGAVVDRLERRAGGGWAHEAPVEHVGSDEIRRVLMPAGDDVAAVDLANLATAQRPGVRRRQLRVGDDDAGELLPFRQLAIRDGPIVGADDAAIARGQRRAIDLPLRRGAIDQQRARGGGGARQLRRHARRGLRAEGAGVPGREIGVAHHQRDRLDRHAQLVANRLRE